MFKSKWLTAVGMLGALGAISGGIWIHLERLHSGAGYYESVGPDGAVYGMHIDHFTSVPPRLVFWTGWWLLLMAIILTSRSRWLRLVAILGSVPFLLGILAGLFEIKIPGIETYSSRLLSLIGLGWSILLIAAIASIAAMIASWMKNRRAQSS